MGLELPPRKFSAYRRRFAVYDRSLARNHDLIGHAADLEGEVHTDYLAGAHRHVGVNQLLEPRNLGAGFVAPRRKLLELVIPALVADRCPGKVPIHIESGHRRAGDDGLGLIADRSAQSAIGRLSQTRRHECKKHCKDAITEHQPPPGCTCPQGCVHHRFSSVPKGAGYGLPQCQDFRKPSRRK